MPRRHWAELTDDDGDVSVHLRIARSHPGTPAGQASTRALLKHYRAAAENEMRAHHAHLAGRIREGEFRECRVDPMLEDFVNWLKRKVFCSDDPIAEVMRLVGDRKTKLGKSRAGKKL
jgi:hypothetical protein